MDRARASIDFCTSSATALRGSLCVLASHRITIGGITLGEELFIIAGNCTIDPKNPNYFYETAAAVMLKGMTVRFLLRQTYKVTPGTTMLLHAAAGGIGLIDSQWARHIGATIIGTVSTSDKAELAKAHGCRHVINYKTEDFVKRTKELTNGQGVDVVYDAVGNDTYPCSLDCLKPLGLWVSFGNASGAITNFDLLGLSAKGSLYATRPTLGTYVAKREDLLANANELFDVVSKGIVKINVNHTYPLKDAAQAHRDLEGRKTTGSIVLLP